MVSVVVGGDDIVLAVLRSNGIKAWLNADYIIALLQLNGSTGAGDEGMPICKKVSYTLA